MSYYKMTVRANNNGYEVLKLKRERFGGYATDMAGSTFTWFVSAAAKPKFTGSYHDCLEFIRLEGAEFMKMSKFAI